MSNKTFVDLAFFWKMFIDHTHGKLSNNIYDDAKLIYLELNELGINPNEVRSYEEIYDKISEFINQNLDVIIYNKLLTNDPYRVSIFYTNIKRIEKIIDRSILEYDVIHIQLLKLYLTITDEHNLSVTKQKIVSLILDYAIDKDIKHINNIFSLGIELKHSGVLDKLKNHVDILLFLDESNKDRNIKIILRTKGDKLLKFLKPIEYK
ncbi:hypothetical protein QKU48_gp0809 [Fadolivirus algeromassiliense]|jgi:hypothetical protein|uniref:Uncharacterized protein n=1 Tax=Fadolivirus FV1/VV64 TaxID=3070911 RepID=A0A7D3QUM4_9VIRU|nr:hypothetical protein QKU48_gp0809 [Fadolivirus algeromassiliense]QKF94267.1 hypothetical protein Fadolivirus_1_809 [Fadolivirus FV1/VV64]